MCTETQAPDNLFIVFRGKKTQADLNSDLNAVFAETLISNFKSKLPQMSWLQTITGLDTSLVLAIYWRA